MSKQTFSIPYGREQLHLLIEKERLKAVLEPNQKAGTSADDSIPSGVCESDQIRLALEQPIASQRLCELARKAYRVLIITSDHTRPLPSVQTIPALLSEIRRYHPQIEVKILVGTGFHRLTTKKELLEKFGPDLVLSEEIMVHDSRDSSHMVCKGILPSGGALCLNEWVDWADLIVAEGFIEPHFFAGFSGGRKSVLPGIAEAKTILANHCAEFIASPFARSGILPENPVNNDMLFAANQAGLAFILNVALDPQKKIIKAFAGHPIKAHLAGCDWVGKRALVERVEADLVITSNGGYPLDQNIYQSVKGMTAAEACVRKGGVIIMVASCEEGHGGEAFYRWLAEAKSPSEVTAKILSIPRNNTLPDQWQAQILARILERCSVILVTDRCAPDLIYAMHMKQADTIDQALEMALKLIGKDPEIVLIPDGVSVIVSESIP